MTDKEVNSNQDDDAQLEAAHGGVLPFMPIVIALSSTVAAGGAIDDALNDTVPKKVKKHMEDPNNFLDK